MPVPSRTPQFQYNNGTHVNNSNKLHFLYAGQIRSYQNMVLYSCAQRQAILEENAFTFKCFRYVVAFLLTFLSSQRFLPAHLSIALSPTISIGRFRDFEHSADCLWQTLILDVWLQCIDHQVWMTIHRFQCIQRNHKVDHISINSGYSGCHGSVSEVFYVGCLLIEENMSIFKRSWHFLKIYLSENAPAGVSTFKTQLTKDYTMLLPYLTQIVVLMHLN